MGLFASLAARFFRRPSAVEVYQHGGNMEHGGVRGPLVLHPAGRVWELPDRDDAMRIADASGDYQKIARLCDAARADGLIRGLLDMRAAVLSFPLIYDGDPWVLDQLRGSAAEYDDATGATIEPARKGMWKRLFPRSELRSVHDDGLMGGAGVGYLVDDPRPGGWRRLKHLEMHWLRYQHHDESWWYQTQKRGLVRVTPGDGRWCLFTPYGRERPWAKGLWYPSSGPFISKQGASIDRLRWQRFLADALRWIEQSEQASEVHTQEMVRFMREGWQFAPGLVAPKGYKPQITESNGKGYEVYTDTEDRGDREIMVAFTGSVVPVDGGKGFSSGDIWNNVNKELIQDTADALSTWCTEEVLDPWTSGIGLGAERVSVQWDARDPSQKQAAAEAGKAAADTVKALDEVAATRGQRVRLAPFLRDHGVEVELEALDAPGAPAPAVRRPAPTLPGTQAPPLLPAAAAEPAEDPAARLAEVMTQHAVDRCEHGSINRCRLCGVERERELVPGKRGAPHTWKIVWRPIPASATAGRVTLREVAGLRVAVERPKGSVRSGKGPDGKPWAVIMACDYGEILGTLGADGEPIDAYLGDAPDAESAYLVSQVREDGSPDELKVMLGFPSEEAARAAYLAHVPAWCLGSLAAVPVGALGAWLSSGTVGA